MPFWINHMKTNPTSWRYVVGKRISQSLERVSVSGVSRTPHTTDCVGEECGQSSLDNSAVPCAIYWGHSVVSSWLARLFWRDQDDFLHMRGALVGITGKLGSAGLCALSPCCLWTSPFGFSSRAVRLLTWFLRLARFHDGDPRPLSCGLGEQRQLQWPEDRKSVV